MGRPAKWTSPTVALRVPERFAETLLAIAKQMDEGTTYRDGSQDCVQNNFGGAERSSVVEVRDQLRLAVGDRVRLRCGGQDPRWHGKEAEIVSFPFVKVRVEDDEFCWSGDQLELLHSASSAGESSDEDGLSPENAALVNEMVDKVFAECEASHVSPEKVLLYLKRRELIDFLSNFRPQNRKEFVVRLLNSVMQEEVVNV